MPDWPAFGVSPSQGGGVIILSVHSFIFSLTVHARDHGWDSRQSARRSGSGFQVAQKCQNKGPSQAASLQSCIGLRGSMADVSHEGPSGGFGPHQCVCAQSCLSCNPKDYIVHQAPLSVGFSRQEYWSELPCPPPGDLPNLRTEPGLSLQR